MQIFIKGIQRLTKSKNAEVLALVKDIIGTSTMPSFKAFSEKAKEGQKFLAYGMALTS